MLTDEIYEERFKSLGGSEVPAACGISKWMTPYELFQYKKYRIEKEKTQAYQEMLQIRSELEEPVAKLFCARTGMEVWKHERIKRNPEFPWLHANVDRYIKNKNAILECKTADYRKEAEFGEEYTCDIPKEYVMQVATYCLVLDCECAYIAVLIGLNDFRIYKYERNRALEGEIVRLTRKFWYDHVVPEIPPPLTEQDDLDRIYRTVQGSQMEATIDIALYAKELQEISSDITAKSKRRDELKQILKLYMGETESLLWSGEIILKNTPCSRKTVSVESLKKAYPKVYEDLVKETPYKRLIVKKGAGYV